MTTTIKGQSFRELREKLRQAEMVFGEAELAVKNAEAEKIQALRAYCVLRDEMDSLMCSEQVYPSKNYEQHDYRFPH